MEYINKFKVKIRFKVKMKTIYFKSISPRTSSKTRATVTQVNWLLAELSYRCPLQCAYCSNPVEIAEYQTEISTAEW